MTSQKHHSRHSKIGKLFFAGRGLSAFGRKPEVKPTILPVETAIYVPSTEYDEQIPHGEFEKRIDEVRKELSNLFGGYTSVSATGGWVDNGAVIKEPIVKVISYTDPKNYKKNRNTLQEYLSNKRKSWKQSALSWEFNNKLYFLSGKEQFKPETKQAKIGMF